MRCLAKYSFLIVFCSGFYCPVTFAEVQSFSVPIDVDVIPECRFSTTPLMFGHYRPHSRFSTEIIVRVTVLCTLNMPYVLSLDQGAEGVCNDAFTSVIESKFTPTFLYLVTKSNPYHGGMSLMSIRF